MRFHAMPARNPVAGSSQLPSTIAFEKGTSRVISRLSRRTVAKATSTAQVSSAAAVSATGRIRRAA